METINYQSTIDEYLWSNRETIAVENDMTIEAVSRLAFDWFIARNPINSNKK